MLGPPRSQGTGWSGSDTNSCFAKTFLRRSQASTLSVSILTPPGFHDPQSPTHMKKKPLVFLLPVPPHQHLLLQQYHLSLPGSLPSVINRDCLLLLFHPKPPSCPPAPTHTLPPPIDILTVWKCHAASNGGKGKKGGNLCGREMLDPSNPWGQTASTQQPVRHSHCSQSRARFK